MVSNILLLWNAKVGFIQVNEGSGDNLFPEDEEKGFADYIMLDTLMYDGYSFKEYPSEFIDCAQIMLPRLYQDMFHSVKEVIQYLIDGEWIPNLNYICLYAK